MGALILGVALLVALLFFLKWYSTAPPASLWRVLKWGGLAISIVLVGFLLLRGGFQFLWVCGSVSCAVAPADARNAKLGAGGETESIGADVDREDAFRCDGA